MGNYSPSSWACVIHFNLLGLNFFISTKDNYSAIQLFFLNAKGFFFFLISVSIMYRVVNSHLTFYELSFLELDIDCFQILRCSFVFVLPTA